MKISENIQRVKIKDSVIDLFKKYIQYKQNGLESGRIIIVKENLQNKDYTIGYATEPYKNDKRKGNRFKRLDTKHIETCNSIYLRSGKIYRYVGEWHTHPEAIPQYSDIDLKNWGKIAKGSDEISLYFHIIVGYEAYRIWKYEKSGIIELLETIYWGDRHERNY